jgi:hypothetical protein
MFFIIEKAKKKAKRLKKTRTDKPSPMRGVKE